LPSPEAIYDMAREAADAARADLRRRGVDPGDYPRLMWAVEHAAGQLVAARMRGRDTAPYQAYVDEVRRRLEAPRPVDDPGPPPKRTLAIGGHNWPHDAA
jgi:hypothetical protein